MNSSELNKKYREADSKRYANNPMVLGVEIRPSATNKKRIVPDLEIRLAGIYPSWFKWNGWCDNDLSFFIPVLMSEEMMSHYQRLVARGQDTRKAIKELQKDARVETLPEAFKEWAKETISNQIDFASAPYFIKENFKDCKHLQLHINKK